MTSSDSSDFPTKLAENAPREYLQHATGFFKAEVFVGTLKNGETVVCKDYSRFCHFWNAPLAIWLCQREYRILKQLEDWPHAPKVFTNGNRLLLIQQYIPGKILSRRPPAEACRVIYHTLFRSLIQLHRRGIVHNDIRGANIILSDNNFPVLIDFTTAWSLANRFGFRKISRWLRLFELRHLLKFKRQLQLPITKREERLLARPRWQQAIIDSWKKGILPLLKRQ